MDYQAFLQRVQEHAGLSDTTTAERAVEATLETLSERLYRTDIDHLAAQLPNDLKKFFSRRDTYDKYSLEEFYNRVASRAGVGFPHGVKQSRAVMATLQEAISSGQIDQIMNSLPSEFKELLSREPEGPLSPTSKSPERPEAEPKREKH